jgi:release factor glutamine methyltransferase
MVGEGIRINVSVSQWLRLAESALDAAGFSSARLEAQLLAAHVLRVDRTWLFAHPEDPFPEHAGHHLLERRLSQEPMAYILGRREFYGRDFAVDRRVLIPRQETETLVEAALGLQDPVKVLDIGVGSGAIAVTLALERPGWMVTGVDVSSEALEVARQNALTLGADVRLIRSDLFSELANETFDLIVSNPPYIGRDEVLPAEVSWFEPHGALYAPEKGLAVYRRLAVESAAHLCASGSILMEVGYRQSADVQRIFVEHGWREVGSIRDLSGAERVVRATRPEANERPPRTA